MDISGKSHEGWMIAIPAGVLVLFVVGALGGPVAFMNTLRYWAGDLMAFVSSLIKSL